MFVLYYCSIMIPYGSLKYKWDWWTTSLFECICTPSQQHPVLRTILRSNTFNGQHWIMAWRCTTTGGAFLLYYNWFLLILRKTMNKLSNHDLLAFIFLRSSNSGSDARKEILSYSLKFWKDELMVAALLLLLLDHAIISSSDVTMLVSPSRVMVGMAGA